MAVPKKKVSKSRRNMRRSHLSIKGINVVIDTNNGEFRLQHHMSLLDYTYNNKQIIINKLKDS